MTTGTITGLPVYSTEFLIGAFGVLDLTNPFLLELAFGAEQVFETEFVAFDKVDRARRLAPFVSPYARGSALKQQGFTTKDFRPAYVKPKHIVDPSRPLKRMPGERLLGAFTPEERYHRVIAELLAQQDDEIKRREEWMAAQILINGSVVIEGENYAPQQVSFGRPASHTVQLTGPNAWGQSGVSALGNLRTWNSLVMTDSGYNANIVVFDPVAAQLFTNDTLVQQILNNRVNSPIGADFKIGNIQLAGVNAGAVGEEVKYLGFIGEFHCFVYNQIYVDALGNTQTMLPPGTVLMLAPKGFQGTRCYGAIMDPKAGYRGLPRFPKMWTEEDPAVTNLMTQSAPLLVTGWPEASFSANVVY
jgi:hypothetical protein